jgi:hypothetical protein
LCFAYMPIEKKIFHLHVFFVYCLYLLICYVIFWQWFCLWVVAPRNNTSQKPIKEGRKVVLLNSLRNYSTHPSLCYIDLEHLLLLHSQDFLTDKRWNLSLVECIVLVFYVGYMGFMYYNINFINLPCWRMKGKEEKT